MKLLIMEFTYCQLQVLTEQFSYPTESLSNESLEEEVSSHAYTSHRTRHSSDLFTISCRKNIDFFFKSAPNTGVNLYFEGWVWLTA